VPAGRQARYRHAREDFSGIDGRDRVSVSRVCLQIPPLKARRISIRPCYATCNDRDTIQFMVGEAF
jgi:hypothetical protein